MPWKNRDFIQHRRPLLPANPERPSWWASLGGSDCAVCTSLEVCVVCQSPALLLGTEDVAVVLRHVSLMAPAIFVCLLCPSHPKVWYDYLWKNLYPAFRTDVLAQAVPKPPFPPALRRFTRSVSESGFASGVAGCTAMIPLAVVSENTFFHCFVSRVPWTFTLVHRVMRSRLSAWLQADGGSVVCGARQAKVTMDAVLMFGLQTQQPQQTGPGHMSALKWASDVLLTWPCCSLGHSGKQII